MRTEFPTPKKYERESKDRHDFIKHELLVREIKGIKKELSMIKQRQTYLEDSLLSTDDVRALKQAREDFEHRRTVSLSEVKRKLNL